MPGHGAAVSRESASCIDAAGHSHSGAGSSGHGGGHAGEVHDDCGGGHSHGGGSHAGGHAGGHARHARHAGHGSEEHDDCDDGYSHGGGCGGHGGGGGGHGGHGGHAVPRLSISSGSISSSNSWPNKRGSVARRGKQRPEIARVGSPTHGPDGHSHGGGGNLHAHGVGTIHEWTASSDDDSADSDCLGHSHGGHDHGGGHGSGESWPALLAGTHQRHPRIGMCGSISLLANNMAGPGMVTLCAVYQDAGWLSTTFALLLVWVMSTITASMLCEAIVVADCEGRCKTSHHHDVELTTLARAYIPHWAFVIIMGTFVVNMQSRNIASVVEASQVRSRGAQTPNTARSTIAGRLTGPAGGWAVGGGQVLDGALLALFDGTCAVELYPTPAAYCIDQTTNSTTNSPFDRCGPEGGCSRRRDCHSAAPPSTFSRCFNSDGERASAI